MKYSLFLSFLHHTDSSPQPTINYIMVGHSQQLQVFSNQVMVWSAQLPHPPVSLTVGRFE